MANVAVMHILPRMAIMTMGQLYANVSLQTGAFMTLSTVCSYSKNRIKPKIVEQETIFLCKLSYTPTKKVGV